MNKFNYSIAAITGGLALSLGGVATAEQNVCDMKILNRPGCEVGDFGPRKSTPELQIVDPKRQALINRVREAWPQKSLVPFTEAELSKHPAAAAANENSEARTKATEHNNDGVKLLINKDYKRALKEFTKALKIKPDYGLGYTNRIIANDRLGNCKEVVADYEELLYRDLHTLKSYIALVDKSHIASCYAKLGLAKQKHDKTAAREYFNKAIKLDPCSIYFRYRGELNQILGNEDDAKKDFEQERHLLEISRPKSET